MLFDSLSQLIGQRAGFGGCAEAAVVHVSSGTARRLCKFGRGKASDASTIVFLQCRESHVIDVHIQAHTDGIGGNQIVDLAGLVHGDLRIAGTWTERT